MGESEVKDSVSSNKMNSRLATIDMKDNPMIQLVWFYSTWRFEYPQE